MRDDKTKLTPENEPKEEPSTEAKKPRERNSNADGRKPRASKSSTSIITTM